jgi:two-component system phosphate regulon sensor histidine kinase PhoR
MSFRKKMFLGQLALVVVFLVLLFPFISKTVKETVADSLEESTNDLVLQLRPAHSETEMIEILQTKEIFLFFRVSLLNDQGELLYDSHLPKQLGDKYAPTCPTRPPEIVEALKTGGGYYEGYSQIFAEKFAYVASAFDLAGKRYVLRAAYPYSQVEDIIQNFERAFLIISAVLLLFFSALTWLIFNRQSKPIRLIIDTIRGAKKNEPIPEITLPTGIGESDDFGQLARTLNSLSSQVRSQIHNLTEERNEKEAILESLGEGVIAVDHELALRYINFIGAKMLAAQRRHLIGKPLATITVDKLRQPLLEKCLFLLETCQERGTILTDSIALGDGKKLYLDLIAAPKASGSGAILVLQDKSSNYKVLEMGKDFVANASHELRTPITIIRGFAETLQDMPDLPREMMSEMVEKIVRNCQRMDTLVKNLLSLADIDNIPESRFQPCDIVTLIEGCVMTLRSVYATAHIRISKNHEEVVMDGDSDLLELALMNLLDNAAKYSSAPADISIRIDATDEEVTIAIRDKGIGIPQSDLEHIFERFYTVDKAHSRKLGGAGLGLSLVKTIVEKHDGTITATSRVGEGTEFVVIFPLQRSNKR